MSFLKQHLMLYLYNNSLLIFWFVSFGKNEIANPLGFTSTPLQVMLFFLCSFDWCMANLNDVHSATSYQQDAFYFDITFFFISFCHVLYITILMFPGNSRAKKLGTLVNGLQCSNGLNDYSVLKSVYSISFEISIFYQLWELF